MKYTKVRDVKDPERGSKLAAGIDFFVPKFDESFRIAFSAKNTGTSIIDDDVFDKDTFIQLGPHDRALIPSGVHVKLPEGYALIAHNKSGIATRKGLDRLAEVVDEDYQGEVHISIVNTGKEYIKIHEDEKLIQFVLVKVGYNEPEKIESLEKLYPEKTERGEGGFGSTGN